MFPLIINSIMNLPPSSPFQKGKMEEINRHFSTLYGYKAPRYQAESLLHLDLEEALSLAPVSPTSSLEDEESRSPESSTSPEHQPLFQTPDSPSPYCQDPPCGDAKVSVAPESPNSHTWAWPTKSPTPPELVSFPGMDYSMIFNPTGTPLTPQDFYSCVHGVTGDEMVQLVPCAPTPLICSPYCQLKQDSEEDPEKRRQLSAFLEMHVKSHEQEEKEQGDYAQPLLPPPTDRR